MLRAEVCLGFIDCSSNVLRLESLRVSGRLTLVPHPEKLVSARQCERKRDFFRHQQGEINIDLSNDVTEK